MGPFVRCLDLSLVSQENLRKNTREKSNIWHMYGLIINTPWFFCGFEKISSGVVFFFSGDKKVRKKNLKGVGGFFVSGIIQKTISKGVRWCYLSKDPVLIQKK